MTDSVLSVVPASAASASWVTPPKADTDCGAASRAVLVATEVVEGEAGWPSPTYAAGTGSRLPGSL